MITPWEIANGRSVLTANGRDDGAERETRVKPCTRSTWCVKELDHSGPCVEVPREPNPAPNYGPKR